jgi:O-antigen ligase
MEQGLTVRNPPARFSSFISSGVLLAAAVAAGFVLFAMDSPQRMLLVLAGGVCVVALLCYPEFALALYVVVGDVKGDERVASLLPVDLTLALGAVLLAGIALNFIRKKSVVAMPPAYLLFVALAALMAASLSYTPVPEAGLEKLARFLTVTGIVIVAPFFVLGTPGAMKRFLAGFSVAGFAICGYSLTKLGGSERLVTPSSNTIGLGHIACALIVLIWFGLVAQFSIPQRMLTYLLLIIPGVALLGSGSRGAVVALGIVVLASLFFYRRLILDLLCIVGLGIVVVPFLQIPASAFEYVGSLIRSRSISALLSFRGDLFDYGWKLLQQHPLIGAGLQGYRYHSPNAGVYNWPHNIFLEIACELGIPAGLIICALFASALRESFRQPKDRLSPSATLARISAGLLVIGIVNATNTGDINSDRSTWLFLSLVYVVRGYGNQTAHDSLAMLTRDAPREVAA